MRERPFVGLRQKLGWLAGRFGDQLRQQSKIFQEGEGGREGGRKGRMERRRRGGGEEEEKRDSDGSEW